MTRTFQLALAGVGIQHSPSPSLHRQLLALSGFAGDSRLLDGVPWANVEALLRRGELNGASVTTPYKRLAAAAIDAWPGSQTSAPRPSSVNTVWWHDEQLWGTSTDGPGLAEVLSDLEPWSAQRVWILGTGGAALALAHTFCDRGGWVAVTGRDPKAAEELAASAGCTAWPWGAPLPGVTLVVHASRWGHGQVGAPELATWSWLPWERWTQNPVNVVDIVYSRSGLTWFEQQSLLAKVPLAQPSLPGLRRGAGLDMLLAQAALAFAHITGEHHSWRLLRDLQ